LQPCPADILGGPQSLAQNAYITNASSSISYGSVSVIATATNMVSATIPVGVEPLGVAVTPDGSKVYVTNALDNTTSPGRGIPDDRCVDDVPYRDRPGALFRDPLAGKPTPLAPRHRHTRHPASQLKIP
jgi:YVTN family beta-propeller protein